MTVKLSFKSFAILTLLIAYTDATPSSPRPFGRAEIADDVIRRAEALTGPAASYQSACKTLEQALKGKVQYPVSGGGAFEINSAYRNAVYHGMANAQQVSACVAQPSSPADIATILKVVGQTRTPFAVKGGGHTCNPGFSATPGIHIDMSAFSDIKYDSASKNVKVGTGLVWDQVYAALEPYNRGVLGARVRNVGVGGFTLGGGYSWQSGERGLASDQTVAFDVVLSNGTFMTVTSGDLFWALRGGLNRFGVVTGITLKTYPQTQVWGGQVTYDNSQVRKVLQAVTKFDQNYTDPKAVYIASILYTLGQPGVTLALFYNAPTPPPGLYDDFLNIPSLTKDVKTRSFLSLVQSSPSDAVNGNRGLFNTVPTLNYTAPVVNEIYTQMKKWGDAGRSKNAYAVGINIEPYHPRFLCSSASRGPSAYPRSCSNPVRPLHFAFYWQNTGDSHDTFWRNAITSAADEVSKAVTADGQTSAGKNAAHYPNYAMYDEDLAIVYKDNLPRLRQVQRMVDPAGVMSLQGGFRI